MSDRSTRPWWVRLVLLGLSSRGVAITVQRLLLAVGVACLLYEVARLLFALEDLLPPGVANGSVLLAWWYWAAVKWVDDHGGW